MNINRGVIGAIVALFASALAVFDIKLTDDQTQTVAEAVFILVGIVTALYSRPPKTNDKVGLWLVILLLPLGGCQWIQDNPAIVRTALRATIAAVVAKNPDLGPILNSLGTVIMTVPDSNPKALEAAVSEFVVKADIDPKSRVVVQILGQEGVSLYREIWEKERQLSQEEFETVLALIGTAFQVSEAVASAPVLALDQVLIVQE